MRSLILSLCTLMLIADLSAQTAESCICYGWSVHDFCRSVDTAQHEVGLFVFTDSIDYSLRQIVLLETIHGSFPQDTLQLKGADGVNCGEDLGAHFSIGDTVVLGVLPPWLGQEYPYFLPGCNKNFTFYRNDTVGVWANDEYMSFESFLENPYDCLNQKLVNVSEEISPAEKVRLVPNPATDYVSIQTEQPLLSARLYTINGQLLHTEYSARIEVAHLQSGVYLLSILTERGITTKKFIKQ